MKTNKIISNKDAIKLFTKLGGEFAVVNNPGFVFSPVEFYPLAKKQKLRKKKLEAVVMDMDGTTTTTETLCLYSLDRMIALMSGQPIDSPRILDKILDYPNIIGNSTTKHVEYLINKYAASFKIEKIVAAFLFAASWTIKFGNDSTRKKEVELNLKNFNCSSLMNEKYFSQKDFSIELKYLPDSVEKKLRRKFAKNFRQISKDDLVKIGVDIYYQKYHQLLRFVVAKNRKELKIVIDGEQNEIIEPMPGVEIFLPLIKGLIKKDHRRGFDFLLQAYKKKCGLDFPKAKAEKAFSNFISLAKHFEKHPMKIAVVTSSIFYEAEIVLRELFKVIHLRLKLIYPREQSALLRHFESYEKYYDAVITASDSSEIRLKPHRDLYSIGLSQLNIAKNNFYNVLGLEDSESGTIAIRAAGIGFAIALPFNETSGHKFDAASHVLFGGLPELILVKNCFVNI